MMKLTLWEVVKVVIGPTVIVLMATLASHSTTQARISTVETKIETIDRNGSTAYQLQKDKYFQQQMELLNRFAAVEQGQKDLKEDVAEIKRLLTNNPHRP